MLRLARGIMAWAGAVLLTVSGVLATEPIRVLIVDGQNNHGVWPKTTQMMKSYLQQSGRFTVDTATAAP